MSIHIDEPRKKYGAKPENAQAGMILIHGRGAGADDMIGLAAAFGTDRVAYIAPQAAGKVWYPESFMAPGDLNQQGISSAFEVITEVIETMEAAGLAREKIMLLGFSQGACLVSDYAARYPGRYGGVFALSGGLIGQTLSRAEYNGSLERTPVFFGCSDVDYYIPKERVEESARIMEDLNADVTMRLYTGMSHTVNEDEIEFVRSVIAQNLSG
jgi:phospholipase/carboxylesterase